MEEKQAAATARKRKRFDWWKKNSGKVAKVSTTSEKLPKEKSSKNPADFPTEKSSKKPADLQKEKSSKKSADLPIEKELKQPIEDQVEQEKVGTDEQEDKKKRYILFVGNLPFDLKEEDVKRHFKCAGTMEFRLMTKKTGESKGCGFLEFDNKEGYWKALKLHHSVVAGRKINVEISCGGGGKGVDRKKKLKDKQEKFRKKRKRKSPKKVQSEESKSAPPV